VLCETDRFSFLTVRAVSRSGLWRFFVSFGALEQAELLFVESVSPLFVDSVSPFFEEFVLGDETDFSDKLGIRVSNSTLPIAHIRFVFASSEVK
jgi:hypothetical protein